MFIQNKYTKCYNSIIAQAKSRILAIDVKKERHHIIPKSIGGSNDIENLVYLTLREHILCHRLLVKMLQGDAKYKMGHAINLMSHSGKYRITSRTFATIKSIKRNHTAGTKKKISAAMAGENNPNFGVACTDEKKENIKQGKLNMTEDAKLKNRQNISAAKKGKKQPPRSEEARRNISQAKLGKKRAPFSEEWLANMSASLKGKNTGPHSEERCRKNSEAHKGISNGPMSDESKKKLSESKKGKKLHVDPITGRRYMAIPTNPNSPT